MPQRLWFDFYAQHFDTVEINNSFYRLPTAETFDKWREQAPPGFSYAVKANRFLTQAKKLKDCEEPLGRMMPPFRHLGAALGPVLYQLPPQLRINLDRLDRFLDIAPKDVHNVFEFRDGSWYTEETLAVLDRHGAGFCVHDMPGSASPRWVSGRAAYVRFHGTDGKYHGRYDDAALQRMGRMDGRTCRRRPPRLGLFQQRHRRPRRCGRAGVARLGRQIQAGLIARTKPAGSSSRCAIAVIILPRHRIGARSRTMTLG